MLKQRVSKRMRKKKDLAPRGQLGVSSSRFDELPRFWQERFYHFNVYSGKKQREKLDYMHANPVTRGLVKHPKDWPWSSWEFHFGGEPTLVPMDAVDL